MEVPGLRRVFPDGRDVHDIAGEYPWPGTPWLRASMVATADGAGAGPDARSATISTQSDFAAFVALRDDCDAIIVGAGTARAESYRPPRHARLVVVSASAALDPALPFIADARPDRPPLLVTTTSADTAAAESAGLVVIRAGVGRVDLTAAIARLHASGLVRLVTEGGPTLLAGLTAAGLLDELDLQVTPFLAGGSYDGNPIPRIMAGPGLEPAPAGLALRHVLTDGSTLFLRYVRASRTPERRAR